MPTNDAALIGAVISASVALVVAVGTQVWTSLRARTDRRYPARRAGVIEAQDAALELREALTEYGDGIRPTATPTATAAPVLSADATAVTTAPGLPALEARKRRATGRFEVCVSRVHDPAVALAMSTWQSAAERRFISVEEVTASVEDEWFGYVQELCRLAMVSDTGVTTEKDRLTLREPPALAGE